MILRNFEIQEICLFPDKVFAFSDVESAVLLGRRAKPRARHVPTVRYRQVRKADVDKFKEAYTATAERTVPQRRFLEAPPYDMRLPELEKVWQWLEGLPRLEAIAHVGKGLDYKGRDLPAGAVTISDRPVAGTVPGFARLSPSPLIHELPGEVWMNLAPEVVRSPGTGTTTGVPQVLVNYAPVSRGPWRLNALIDIEGHAVTSAFLTVRPSVRGCPLEFLWAVLNSPLANAYAYAHSTKRHNLTRMVRNAPMPRASGIDMTTVAEAARSYLDLFGPSTSALAPPPEEALARRRLLEVDAEVLRLYDLPPRLERQVLDLFAGHKRDGVPFPFKRYYPEDYGPAFSLHEYLSDEYQRSTAAALRERYVPVTEPDLLAAFERALEDFKD